MNLETNYCTSEFNNCSLNYSCPSEVNSIPLPCVRKPNLSGCQIQVGDICKLCHELYYLKEGQCLPCNDDCVSCYSEEICGVCLMSDQMEPTISGACKQKCPKLLNNQYCDDGVAKTCQSWLVTECKCGTNKFCAQCSTLNECASCLPGFKLVGNECLQCKNGYNPYEGLCIKENYYGGGSIQPENPDSAVTVIGKIQFSVSVLVSISIGVLILVCMIIGLVFYVLKHRQSIIIFEVKPGKLQEV